MHLLNLERLENYIVWVEEMFGMNSWPTPGIDIHFGQYYLVVYLVIGEIVGAHTSQWYKECLHVEIKLI